MIHDLSINEMVLHVALLVLCVMISFWLNGYDNLLSNIAVDCVWRAGDYRVSMGTLSVEMFWKGSTGPKLDLSALKRILSKIHLDPCSLKGASCSSESPRASLQLKRPSEVWADDHTCLDVHLIQCLFASQVLITSVPASQCSLPPAAFVFQQEKVAVGHQLTWEALWTALHPYRKCVTIMYSWQILVACWHLCNCTAANMQKC